MQISGRLVSLFALFPVLFAVGQRSGAQQAFIVRGLVVQTQSGIRVSNVTIRNIRSKGIVMSDELGGFFNKVVVGDTLQFIKAGFADAKIAVIDKNDLVVAMQAEIALKEVSIKEKSITTDTREVLNDYREKGLYFDGSPSLLIFNPVSGSPLTGLHELLGKDAANERRYIRFTQNEQQENYIDNRFTGKLIKSITNLQDAELPVFMDICRPKYNDLKTWSDYQLQLYIKAAYARWKAGNPTPSAG